MITEEPYSPEMLKGNIKLIILAVLESSPLHGYGIAKEIERRSGSELSFGEGSVYPALKSLQVDGFIVGEWISPETGPARKTYRITERGLQELTRRKRVWFRFSKTMGLVLNG